MADLTVQKNHNPIQSNNDGAKGLDSNAKDALLNGGEVAQPKSIYTEAQRDQIYQWFQNNRDPLTQDAKLHMRNVMEGIADLPSGINIGPYSEGQQDQIYQWFQQNFDPMSTDAKIYMRQVMAGITDLPPGIKF